MPDDRIRLAEELLAARMQDGGHLDAAAVESVCRARPDLAPELRSAVSALQMARRALHHLGPDATDALDADAAPLTHPSYEDRGELGRGGMSVVREVFDPTLRRHLAAKILRAKHAGDPRAHSRFLAEAQVTSQLDHPGIVPVHGIGVAENGRPFFTMKLVQGRSLAAVLEDVATGRDGWTVTRAVTVLLRVCEAVDYAHRKGVLHRDLKPGNIMVGLFGEVLVLDWGLAKLAEGTADATVRSARCDLEHQAPDSPLLTGQGDVVGTPHYMAPEQARGDVNVVDARADIYAVGAILYHLLASEPPYRRAGGADTTQVLQLAKAGPPEPLEHFAPSAPRELIAICARAMARAPSDRYSSMLALRADLAAWLEGHVVDAYERGWLPSLRKWVQRNRTIAAFALLVLFAVPTIVALWSYARAQSQQARRIRILRYREDLEEARRTAALIYPAWPDRTAALQAWLRERAAPLAAAAVEVEQVLADVQADAKAGDPLATLLAEVCQRLRTDLRDFHAESTGLQADVRRRLDWALRVQDESIDRHRARWEDARAAIARADGVTASTLYRAQPVLLEPEFDLVPIGMNPVTKLWEFHHLPSAGDHPVTPAYDGDGRIRLRTDTGIVFVLVPGGRFVMGADQEPTSPHYDAYAESNEVPAHEVLLAPFFIARHELTVLQWCRLKGDRTPKAAAATTRPMSLISWQEATDVAERHGLLLPTEAQWEYAARAGTTTRYWSGSDTESLLGVANIADQSARRSGLWWPGMEEAFDDGFPTTAEVDSLRANAFGLHHVHGNASEWVRDAMIGYSAPARPGDGLRGDFVHQEKVHRGGNLTLPARRTRSSFRGGTMGTTGVSAVGARLARSLSTAARTAVARASAAPVLVAWAENGHHYGVVDVALTWHAARADAESRTLHGVRGHLVTITSAAENEFVTTHLVTANAWLGGYQDKTRPDYAEPAGGWRWVTGEPMQFTNWGRWSTNQPDNIYLTGLGGPWGDAPFGSAEDVLQFWIKEPTRWNDVPDHPNVRLPYVIEFDTTVAPPASR